MTDSRASRRSPELGSRRRTTSPSAAASSAPPAGARFRPLPGRVGDGVAGGARVIRHPVASPCASTRARWRSWKRNTRAPSTVCVVKGSSQCATSGRPRERQPATSAPSPANTAHRRSPRVNTAAGTARFHRKRSSSPPGSTRAETVTAGLSWGWACGTAATAKGSTTLASCGAASAGSGTTGRETGIGIGRGGPAAGAMTAGAAGTRVSGRAVRANSTTVRRGRGWVRTTLTPGRSRSSTASGGRPGARSSSQGARVAAAAASTGTGRSTSSDAKSPCKASRAAVGAGQIRTSRPPSGRTSAMTTVCAAGASVAADAAWVAASAAVSIPTRAAVAARTSDHPRR